MFIRPCEGRISSPFGMRTHPLTGKRNVMHWGVDLAKPGNVPVKAAADGVVSRVAPDGTLGTYGNAIMIEHIIDGKIYTTVYAHLANIAVSNRQTVKQGSVIGMMGNTGGSQGQHLHFEIHVGRWNNKYSNAVDPMMYLPLEVAVKSGDRGLNVGYIQGQLKNAGYSIIVDGDFGQATKKVVELFQRDNKLAVDGIAGPATQKVLANVKPPKLITPVTRYSDVGKSHSAYEALERISEAGIITGYTDGTFKPTEPVSRAHVAIIIDRLLTHLNK